MGGVIRLHTSRKRVEHKGGEDRKMLVRNFVRVLTQEYGCYSLGMDGDTRLYGHVDLQEPIRIKGKDWEHVGEAARRRIERKLHIVYY